MPEQEMMIASYQYIRFEQVHSTGKTTVWNCRDSGSGRLGVVKWYGPWRSYCYFVSSEAVYSAGCLADIQHFIGRLMKEREEGR